MTSSDISSLQVDDNDSSFASDDEAEEVENCDQEEVDIFDYLFDDAYLKDIKVELVPGEKSGSEWLIVDDTFILHKKDKSANEVFWECSGRRRFNCPFKCATCVGENGLELSFMYKLETHDCGQTKMGVIMHKFKNNLKQTIQGNYKAKFAKVFEEQKLKLIKSYNDNPDMLEKVLYELKDKRNFRVLAERAKNRCFPKIPNSHDEIDLNDVNLKHIELARTKHPDPEVKDKDIILLGTHTTAEAWAKAEFKSGDGTFKITPKLFFQVFVLMALYGGHYVPCMFGLLPDKSGETYDRFFGMLHRYLEKNNLPNNFQEQFFMCDFEIAIRSSVMLYWPMVRVLGCFFHFSQIVWRRIKKAGFQVCYEKNDGFNALMRRCSSLPFIKKEDLDKAFRIFNQRADDLNDVDLVKFSKDLIIYLNSQWRQGVYSIQDWNLYDLNLLLVPSTNNGNEGQNRRLKENFGTHPKLWDFLLTLNDELESRSTDIPLILLGSLIPPQNENYHALKVEREIAKANYEAGLLSLDQYIGKIGSLSIKAGKAKVMSDDFDDNTSTKAKLVKKSKRTAANKPGYRGRRPMLLLKPQTPIVINSFSVPSSDGPETTVTTSIGASSLGFDMPVLGSNVRIATATTGLDNIPWPSPVGLTEAPGVPATASRTTATTTSCLPRAPATSRPDFSSVVSSNDSLIRHITKNNLGLKQRPAIAGDGNCWYLSIVDLVKLYGLKGPTDSIQLRLAVTNRLLVHPNKRQWIRSIFGGKVRSYNKFVKEQSKPGVFVDRDGLAVYVTSEVLGVTIHIVGTSNNAENPVTVMGDGEKTIHVGYYQDNSDIVPLGSPGYRAGHYQSLEAVGGKTPKCCKSSEASSPASLSCSAVSLDVEDASSIVQSIKNEEYILKVLKNDGAIVKACLERLWKLKNISVDQLFQTNICQILYTDIRNIFSVETSQGKICRRLLRHYQSICQAQPDFNGELPDVTLVDEDAFQTSHEQSRNFRNLFTGDSAASLSFGIENISSASLAPLQDIPVPRSSSTVLDMSLASLPQEESRLADASSTRGRRNRSPPMSSVFSDESSLPQPKRARGRPPKTQVVVCAPVQPLAAPQPPQRRRPGRPPKNKECATFLETEIACESSVVLTPPPSTPPPTKRRPGRPRKIGN